MNVDKIGENAGKVWNQLHEKGPQSAGGICKATKLTAPETERVIGWLAREGKLNFQEDGKTICLGSMNADKIGENAGKVWNQLHEKGPQSVGGICKATKLTAPETERAIGWLAREGKLNFQEDGKTICLK